MLSGIELYRQAFEHEIEANHAMLKMLGSVPSERRSDPLFQRAVNIAAHMASCRLNFVEVFKGLTLDLREPFETAADFGLLEARFTSMESDWKDYLAGLDEVTAEGFFVFADGGEKWKIRLEAQLFQLIGHAAYHRGQVVLLADLLGGETFDTDYIEWFTNNHPEGWGKGD